MVRAFVFSLPLPDSIFLVKLVLALPCLRLASALSLHGIDRSNQSMNLIDADLFFFLSLPR